VFGLKVRGILQNVTCYAMGTIVTYLSIKINHFLIKQALLKMSHLNKY